MSEKVTEERGKVAAGIMLQGFDKMPFSERTSRVMLFGKLMSDGNGMTNETRVQEFFISLLTPLSSTDREMIHLIDSFAKLVEAFVMMNSEFRVGILKALVAFFPSVP